ncbi:MAG: ABC transporter permease [Solirubrobacterales bacterium]
MTPDAVDTSEARRVLNLSLTLAASEFKMRYFGSVLGYFWTLARPLLLFGVLYLAFTHFIRFGGGIEFYPAYLLTAIVLWTYFSDVTSVSVTSRVPSLNRRAWRSPHRRCDRSPAWETSARPREIPCPASYPPPPHAEEPGEVDGALVA